MKLLSSVEKNSRNAIDSKVTPLCLLYCFNVKNSSRTSRTSCRKTRTQWIVLNSVLKTLASRSNIPDNCFEWSQRLRHMKDSCQWYATDKKNVIWVSKVVRQSCYDRESRAFFSPNRSQLTFSGLSPKPQATCASIFRLFYETQYVARHLHLRFFDENIEVIYDFFLHL